MTTRTRKYIVEYMTRLFNNINMNHVLSASFLKIKSENLNLSLLFLSNSIQFGHWVWSIKKEKKTDEFFFLQFRRQ